jgi:hypothetical protein
LVKNRASASTHKKVVILLLDRTTVRGYLDAGTLGRVDSVDLLTPEGEHKSIPVDKMKSVYFVRELNDSFELERKAFLSRPKLDGLWVRLRFRDEDVVEGIIPNDLLDLLDKGLHLTPPDLHGNVLRIFVPRAALVELKVLGVVGVARRAPRPARGTAAPEPQPRLFSE